MTDLQKENGKIARDSDAVPENFTKALAVWDAVPVLFFGGTAVIFGKILQSHVFSVGALLALFAGAAKVLWKLIVAIKRKNVRWLFWQMRILMPAAFLLMISGAAFFGKTDFDAVRRAVMSFPQAAFFVAGIAGMITMAIFAFTLDPSDKKANVTEQIINSASQICFFVGAVLTAF